jgi:HAD superfamily hydrolase (TIGR01509 family)
MITTVVFDMDGVLCRTHRDRRLALLSGWSGLSPAAIQAAIFASEFEDEAERGLLSADDYLLGVGERLGCPLTVEQWVQARRATIEPDHAMLALARQLGAEHRIGMFTNNPLLLKRHIGDVFPQVVDVFGAGAVFSAELGRSKPDPEAFTRLAAHLGADPGEILYFDDDARYVEGARRAGLHSEVARGEPAARASLAAHGVTIGGGFVPVDDAVPNFHDGTR